MKLSKIVLISSAFLLILSRLAFASEEAKPAVDEAKPLSGYDSGFFIQSADNQFKLKLNANLQMRYEYQTREAARDNNYFGIPRSRLIFTGHAYTSKLTYMIMPEMGDSDTTHATDDVSANLYMRDLWFNYAATEKIQIKLGQFFLPRSRQAYTISPAQQFGEYPITALNDFGFTWDRGIDFHGSIAKLDYDAYVTNGSGGNLINVSKGMNVGTRVVYNIFGKYGYTEGDLENSEDPNLAVGAHFSFNNNDNFNNATNNTAGDQSPDYSFASADVALKQKGLSLEGEFMNLHNHENGDNNPAVTVQAGYFLIPKKWEVAAEISRIFWDDADNDESEYQAGSSYYFKGHKVKLQGTYAFLVDEN
ncbi:MAG: hypothetical protein HYY43_05535, partial [Deltaproteobacteria bacterium]|nr:hypothetical protein [Deltaproteobacteria bacterium]